MNDRTVVLKSKSLKIENNALRFNTNVQAHVLQHYRKLQIKYHNSLEKFVITDIFNRNQKNIGKKGP